MEDIDVKLVVPPPSSKLFIPAHNTSALLQSFQANLTAARGHFDVTVLDSSGAPTTTLVKDDAYTISLTGFLPFLPLSLALTSSSSSSSPSSSSPPLMSTLILASELMTSNVGEAEMMWKVGDSICEGAGYHIQAQVLGGIIVMGATDELSIISTDSSNSGSTGAKEVPQQRRRSSRRLWEKAMARRTG